jgi:hypothetical protein
MNILIILLIFLIILQLFAYFSLKHKEICDNLKSLSLLINNKNKFNFQKLSKSKLQHSLKNLFNLKHKELYFENKIIESKNYLIALSKFIDYKINNNNITYRTKNDLTIIENLAYIISKQIYSNNPFSLYQTYLSNFNNLSIKQKENKVFKILLAKNLINELIIIEREYIQISKIIQYNKKRKFYFNYFKNILNYAKFYSILKYNKNSTYFKYKYNNLPEIEWLQD